MNSEFCEEYLKIYYKKIFPCDLFCKWLTYGCSDNHLGRREFSFTLAGDIYLRYQSFDSSFELRKELIKLCPHKIDIGAVYSTAPKQNRAIKPASFKPEWKELVFDIDLTDYDEIRYCCGEQNGTSNSAICSRCWPLAQAAVLCVDRALREDFGFQYLLWVYSGRRGVHCWVCDKSARNLDTNARTAIVDYLTLVRGGNSKKPTLTAGNYSKNSEIEPLFHPCVDAAYEILVPRFNSYCSTMIGQNLFCIQNRLEKVLSFLPGEMEELRSRLFQQWSNDDEQSHNDISSKRWNTLRTFLKEKGRTSVIKELVLNYTYPRLDVNVSTSLNHLLKSPFCVHPKTGYICVPFDPQFVETFDPFKVPTLNQVIEEIGTFGADEATGTEDRHLLAFKKTSLKPIIDYFETFISRLLQAEDLEADTIVKALKEHNTNPSVSVF